MIINELLQDYKITTALQPELRKTSREYCALSFLQFSFPDLFFNLRKKEAPDLQAQEDGIGIEVTWGGSPENEIISGESDKYRRARNQAERERSLEIIRKHGGDRNDFCTSYPVGSSSLDKKYLENAINKKKKKVFRYRRDFQRVGLAILIDIPLFFLGDPNWGDWLSDINQNDFDFVCIIHFWGVDLFNFFTRKYLSSRPSREEIEALKLLSRLTAEGIIQDDDSVWYELRHYNLSL